VHIDAVPADPIPAAADADIVWPDGDGDGVGHGSEGVV
jgi:hypothetical protein